MADDRPYVFYAIAGGRCSSLQATNNLVITQLMPTGTATQQENGECLNLRCSGLNFVRCIVGCFATYVLAAINVLLKKLRQNVILERVYI